MTSLWPVGTRNLGCSPWVVCDIWKGCTALFTSRTKTGLLTELATCTLGVPLIATNRGLFGELSTFTVGVPLMPTVQGPLCCACTVGEFPTLTVPLTVVVP